MSEAPDELEGGVFLVLQTGADSPTAGHAILQHHVADMHELAILKQLENLRLSKFRTMLSNIGHHFGRRGQVSCNLNF